MKTTLEIPDETSQQAKVQAALRNIPLRQFVTEAVEEKLAKPAQNPTTPPWMAGFGGLADLADESRRLMTLVEEEFDSIEPEDRT